VIFILWGITAGMIVWAYYPSFLVSYRRAKERRQYKHNTNNINNKNGGQTSGPKRSDLFINKFEQRKIQKMIQRRDENKKHLLKQQRRKQQQKQNEVDVEEADAAADVIEEEETRKEEDDETNKHHQRLHYGPDAAIHTDL
jgi:hypothetical protein